MASLKSLARRLCLDTDGNSQKASSALTHSDGEQQPQSSDKANSQDNADTDSAGETYNVAKKRKLNDGCMETATINDSDKN